MQITRENYSQYATMVQQMFGNKNSETNLMAQLDYGNYDLRFKATDISFNKPDWNTIQTKRSKPAMSESEFEEAIKELARKDFSNGNKDRGAYRELCQRYCEVASPDRKAIYDSSMKKTGGKMNAACMFWDQSGNKTLSWHPMTKNWKIISTDAEIGRGRVFNEIYENERKQLVNKYGSNKQGTISYSEIKEDLSSNKSPEVNGKTGQQIDYKI